MKAEGPADTYQDIRIYQPSPRGLRVDELSLEKDEEVADQEK